MDSIQIQYNFYLIVSVETADLIEARFNSKGRLKYSDYTFYCTIIQCNEVQIIWLKSPWIPPILDLRNLQEQFKKAFCYQKLFCLSVFKQIVLVISKFLQIRGWSREFQKFFRSLEHFFLTVGQKNFGSKIPFLT